MLNNKRVPLIWERLQGEGSKERPSGREGCVFLYLPDKNSYLLFSGVSHIRFADVFVFDMNRKKWSRKNTTGEHPKELCYAVGWYDSPYFFFYGGRNKELTLSDVYFLNTNKWLWKKVFTVDQPLSRFYHAGCKIEGRKFYIFGGINIGKENKLLGDMHIYDYKNDRVGGSIWVPVNMNGTIPEPRKGHTMLYFKNYFILYGGETEKGLNDDKFYKFVVETNTWSIMKVSGLSPSPRAYHSMDFFKKNTIIICGGKIFNQETKKITTTDSLILFDLDMMDCCKPFIGDIGPCPRFGHKSSSNTLFDVQTSRPFNHCIIAGTDKNYCNMDLYLLKEMPLGDGYKWVYCQKNMHNSQKIDGSDEVFETAKKAIIHFKKKYEEATKENITANKVYSELYQIKSRYDKSLNDQAISSNEKKSEIELKKIKIESEKREIQSQSRELKNYHNLLNSYCLNQRDKYKNVIEFITEFLKDIFEIDKLFEKINSMDKEKKMKLFHHIDLDSLTVKRRNYREKLEAFSKLSKLHSLYEKSIYDEIQKLQKSQKEKFKNMYFIVDDKEPFDFTEENENEVDLSRDIIENA